MLAPGALLPGWSWSVIVHTAIAIALIWFQDVTGERMVFGNPGHLDVYHGGTQHQWWLQGCQGSRHHDVPITVALIESFNAQI